MRFLVDESTGQAVAAMLRGLGHDTAIVADDMPRATDAEILARAVAEARIVVTNDKDFGELVYQHHQPHAGVILLRLSDDRASNRVAVIQALLDHHASQLPNRFVVVTELQVRIR